MAAAPILTPADLATELGTDPRTARKFLRSITPKDDQPGKGKRWAIKGTKTEVARMRKAFTTFTAEQEAAKAARAEKEAEAPAPEVEDLDEVQDSLDELEGPTDEELELESED